MKQLIIIFFFAVTILPPTKVEDIQTFTLKNGMKIIVLEDHSIPNASLTVLGRLLS